MQDWRDTAPFHPVTGADQAKNAVIRHHIDYFSDFSSGSYDAGDVTLQNYTCYNSLKCIYWKTYRRGVGSGPLVDGATWDGQTQGAQLPGGSGLVELRNVRFENAAAPARLNHHCARGGEPTGGLCASHYWIRDPLGTYATSLSFWDESFEPSGVHRSDMILEYDNATWFLPTAHRTFDVQLCDNSTHLIHGGEANTHWVRCPQEWGVRIVRIYSPDRGHLHVYNEDEEEDHVVPPFAVQKGWSMPAYEAYSPLGRAHVAGYTFLARAEAALRIETRTRVASDLFVLEYSEDTWPEEKETRVRLEVNETYASPIGFAGGPFWIHSNHTRAWITPYGALLPQAGAWWDATGGWPTTYNASLYEAERVTMLVRQGVDPSRAAGNG